jgi:hypothetical protein
MLCRSDCTGGAGLPRVSSLGAGDGDGPLTGWGDGRTGRPRARRSVPRRHTLHGEEVV